MDETREPGEATQATQATTQAAPPARAAAPAAYAAYGRSAAAAALDVATLARMDTAARAGFVRRLQRHAGNRHVARQTATRPQTLAQRVEEARRTDPAGYVLRAVTGMAGGTYTASERVAEITWRMIHMFLADRIRGTLVSHDASGRGVELSPDPPRARGDVTLRVGTDFVSGITRENLPDRVAILRMVFLGRAALMARLRSDFGFASVIDGTAAWTAGELAVCHAGLSKLPQADRSALSGVVLKRDATVMEHGQSMDGLYHTSSPAITAAMTSAPAIVKELTMASSAFADPDRAIWVVVHEAGHAVDSHALLAAQAVTNAAVVADNVNVDPLNAAAAASISEMNPVLRSIGGFPAAQRAAARTYGNAVLAAHNAINAFAFRTRTAQAEAAADRAVAARDRARTALPAGNPAGTAFARTVELQNDWLARAKAKAATRAALASARTAQAAVTGPNGTSRRLADFVAVVNRHRIQPVTPYARTNWPAHPEEFFADAYSMWLNDRPQLERLARPLAEFFDRGGHR